MQALHFIPHIAVLLEQRHTQRLCWVGGECEFHRLLAYGVVYEFGVDPILGDELLEGTVGTACGCLHLCGGGGRCGGGVWMWGGGCD